MFDFIGIYYLLLDACLFVAVSSDFFWQTCFFVLLYTFVLLLLRYHASCESVWGLEVNWPTVGATDLARQMLFKSVSFSEADVMPKPLVQ